MTPSPYIGLAPYQQSDEPFFFGRTHFVETLKQKVLTEDVTILYGASGVGKTSTLNAGLISALAQEQAAVVTLRRWQDRTHWLEEAKRQILEFAPDAGPGLDAPLASLVRAVASRMDRDLVLLFDQFEELFTYASQDQSAIQEIGELLGSHSPGVHIIVSLRDDFLSRLDAFKRQAPGILRTVVRLERLNELEAREAIIRPAEMAGISIEDGLPEMVIQGRQSSGSETRDNPPNSAPQTVEAAFLQIVMSRLWEEEARLGSRILRKETLQRLGPGRLVSTHLENKLAQLSTKERDACAYAFRYMVTTAGTKAAQTPEDLADWAEVELDVLREALERLTYERVLTRVAGPDGRVRFEIYHDLLVPDILGWRTRYLQQRDVKKARKQARRYWMLALACATAVIFGLGAYAGLQWIRLKRVNGELTQILSDKDRLLQAYDRAQKKASDEETQRVAAESLRLSAEKAKGDAEQRGEDEYGKRKSAELLKIAQQQQIHPDLGVWLLAKALQLQPDVAIQSELARRLGKQVTVDRYLASSPIFGARDISDDGKVAADVVGNRIRIWDIESRLVRQHLPAPRGFYGLQLNADGSRIGVMSSVGLQIIDAATGKAGDPTPCPQAYNRGSRRLDPTFRYSLCSDSRPVLRHVAGGEQTTLGNISHGFSPDGRLVATDGGGDSIAIYSLDPESQPFRLTSSQIDLHLAGVNLEAIAFDASGNSLVTLGTKGYNTPVLSFGSLSRSTRKVDLETPLTLETCKPSGISLSPDGTHAAVNCTGGTQSVIVMDRGSLQRHTLDNAGGCRFGASNDKLLCTARRIEIRGRSGDPVADLPPMPSDIQSDLFNPAGSRLATGGLNFLVVTDSATGDDLWSKKMAGALSLIATSGDGHTLYDREDGWPIANDWDGKGGTRRIPGFLATSFSGQRIAVLDRSKIHIRPADSETDEASLTPFFAPTRAIFVNRDRALALGSYDKPGAMVEITTGKTLYPIPPDANLFASPSGRCLSIKTADQFQTLDTTTGEQHGVPVDRFDFRVLALDDECRNVVTAEMSGTPHSIVVWDVRSGAKRFAWPVDNTFWFSYAAALPPNGREVVIMDGAIEHFPLLSREELIAETLRRVGSKFDTQCQKYLERPCSSGK